MMTVLKNHPNHEPSKRMTELVCHKCDNRWVAKTRVEPLGLGITPRPGAPFQRGALAYRYWYIHSPSNCPKCNREYSGVTGPREAKGES